MILEQNDLLFLAGVIFILPGLDLIHSLIHHHTHETSESNNEHACGSPGTLPPPHCSFNNAIQSQCIENPAVLHQTCIARHCIRRCTSTVPYCKPTSHTTPPVSSLCATHLPPGTCCRRRQTVKGHFDTFEQIID